LEGISSGLVEVSHGIYLEALLATSFQAGFLFGLFFGPEYGSEIFHRNVG
jgi:hypothetical protein